MATGEGVTEPASVLASLTDSVKSAVASSDDLKALPTEGIYYSDLLKMAAGGCTGWGYVPDGAKSLLVLPCGDGGSLVLLGAQPRAFSPRERQWATAIAAKLGSFEA